MLQFGTHPIRLIGLDSAARYWNPDDRSIREMRERPAVVLEAGGKRYRILYPVEMWLTRPEPACPHLNEWPCTEPPCSPLWFRWD